MTLEVLNPSRPRKQPPCPCRCGTRHGFCDDHAAFLAAVRDELNGSGRARGEFVIRRKPGSRPLCTSPGCDNLRQPPADFCEACLEQAG